MENIVINEIKTLLFDSTVQRKLDKKKTSFYIFNSNAQFSLVITRIRHVDYKYTYTMTYGNGEQVNLSQYVLDRVFNCVSEHYDMHKQRPQADTELFDFCHLLLTINHPKSNQR